MFGNVRVRFLKNATCLLIGYARICRQITFTTAVYENALTELCMRTSTAYVVPSSEGQTMAYAAGCRNVDVKYLYVGIVAPT